MNEGMDTPSYLSAMNRIVCCTNLKDALELARPVFGDPLILSSLAKTIIATTREPDLEDRRWLDLKETERVPLECLYHDEIQVAYQESQATKRPVVDKLSEDGLPMLRKVLLVNEMPVGYLESPLYHGIPSSSQLEFFDLLGNFLAGRLQEELKHPSLPDNMLDYFVFDLLEGRITNLALIQERLSYFHWDILEKGFTQIISIRWLDREDQGSIRFRHLAESLLHTFCDCRVFVYGLEIKLICPVSQPLEQNPRFLNQLQSVLQGNLVSAGVSRPLDQLAHIADFHLQAKKASEIGLWAEPQRLLHFFDNLSIYYALELACQDWPPDQFIHYGLVALRNYDAAHDTNLMASLEVYLEHNQSIGETAAALFIHRNTMNYRISKIVELTNLDLKDPSVVDHLRFSFHVLRFSTNRKPEPPGSSGEEFSQKAKISDPNCLK
jgi:hypothetical protein